MASDTLRRSQKKSSGCGTRLKVGHRSLLGWSARHCDANPVFLLHSLAASPSEIPQRFSSSLSPEFAAGRCAAIFIPALAVP
jgi:hypothetical protein